VVEGDGLENRSAKAPGVRIPPPPPTEAAIAGARRRLERLLEKHGLLLLHDARFPSATASVAGEAIRGSWWGHPKGKLIFETLSRIENAVAWAKLIAGKETLVHERLWPALVATAEARQAWQLRGLPDDAKQLLQRVRKGDPVQVAAKGAQTGRKPAVVATDLERRLLARGYTEHTPAGRHARFLETWAAWAGRHGIAKARLPAPADAIQALSAPVIAWVDETRPAGLLPWLATR
jgi:hypothetical protein